MKVETLMIGILVNSPVNSYITFFFLLGNFWSKESASFISQLDF